MSWIHNIIRSRIHACYSLILVFTLWSVVSCKENSSDWIHHTGGHSILDLEYINDTLGIILKDIRVQEIKSNQYHLKIFLLTEEEQSLYKVNYYFFVHLYRKKSKEREGGFVSMITNKVASQNNILVFSGDIETNQKIFEQLRIGLVNPKGERLFTLTVDSVKIR